MTGAPATDGPADGRVACVGCGAAVPDGPGPTHPYLVASPGCWELYGSWMAERVYALGLDAIARAHHVDGYAVQHPGGAEEDRRQRQSVAVHLVSLCLLLEHDQPPERADRVRGRTSATVLPAAGLDDWPFLAPPPPSYEVTIADVVAAAEDGTDSAAVARWAETTWAAWTDHHATVRRWAAIMADAS